MAFPIRTPKHGGKDKALKRFQNDQGGNKIVVWLLIGTKVCRSTQPKTWDFFGCSVRRTLQSNKHHEIHGSSSHPRLRAAGCTTESACATTALWKAQDVLTYIKPRSEAICVCWWPLSVAYRSQGNLVTRQRLYTPSSTREICSLQARQEGGISGGGVAITVTKQKKSGIMQRHAYAAKNDDPLGLRVCSPSLNNDEDRQLF